MSDSLYSCSVATTHQVFLLTDGAVKNTRSVIEYVAARHAATGTRCFAFGIGNDVSHALVTGVAAAGGGDAEFVVPGERMEEKVVRQLSRAMQPVLTQTRVNWGALEPYMITPATPAVMNPIFTGSHAQAFAFVRPDAPVATVTVSAQGPSKSDKCDQCDVTPAHTPHTHTPTQMAPCRGPLQSM